MSTHTAPALEFDQADRMRKARESAGLSQTEMAQRLTIARSSVVNYERRHTHPLPAIRKAWAEACGVDDDWITGVNRIRQYDPYDRCDLPRIRPPTLQAA